MPSAKRWDYPECEERAACDGNVLRGDRIKKGICATCERALAKRNKKVPPRGTKVPP